MQEKVFLQNQFFFLEGSSFPFLFFLLSFFLFLRISKNNFVFENFSENLNEWIIACHSNDIHPIWTFIIQRWWYARTRHDNGMEFPGKVTGTTWKPSIWPTSWLHDVHQLTDVDAIIAHTTFEQLALSSGYLANLHEIRITLQSVKRLNRPSLLVESRSIIKSARKMIRFKKMQSRGISRSVIDQGMFFSSNSQIFVWGSMIIST